MRAALIALTLWMASAGTAAAQPVDKEKLRKAAHFPKVSATMGIGLTAEGEFIVAGEWTDPRAELKRLTAALKGDPSDAPRYLEFGGGGHPAMTAADWRACRDPDPMVRALPADHYQRELRLFAAACVRRVWHLLPADCRAAVQASERFAAGQIGEAELAAVVAVADREAQAAFPGHSAPDACEYAASAAVDASSVWPRTASNVLASTTCAASAAGCAAGEADEARYDEAFDMARVAELAAQAELLRGIVSVPPE